MKENWIKISENLRNMLAPGIFKVWIAPLQVKVLDNQVHIHAPNSFMAKWITNHLIENIRRASAMSLAIPPEAIEILIEAAPAEKRENAASISPPSSPKGAAQGRLPLKMPPMARQNPWKYCFDDFVTGPCNNMAVAAARDLGQSGQVRTLFVNSSPGLGKTHLVQATGQAITSTGNPLRVGYLTAEQFASRFVAAMKSRELEDFKQDLCRMDVLLLEDVHFLQRKKAMQEMLLGIIKNLQSKGARVVFTSSFAPRQFQDMDEQLISHFCSGIMTNMEKPDAEMRREILRRKARSYQVTLPDEICELVSSQLSNDIRQLESCLNSMVFKARLLNSGLTMQLALETLGQYAGTEQPVNLEGIINLVCESFGITRSQLCSRSRRKEFVQGRNTVFYLARKHTDMSLEEIGCIFNRRHSTVVRSLTQVEQEMATESSVGRQIARAVSLIERKCGLGNTMQAK